jgi:hypothetical protein
MGVTVCDSTIKFTNSTKFQPLYIHCTNAIHTIKKCYLQITAALSVPSSLQKLFTLSMFPYLPFLFLTYCTKQSPSWEANRFLASLEVSRIYGTRRFITAFTSVRHLSLSWVSSIQSMPPHPTSGRSILILSSHLRLGVPNLMFHFHCLGRNKVSVHVGGSLRKRFVTRYVLTVRS